MRDDAQALPWACDTPGPAPAASSCCVVRAAPDARVLETAARHAADRGLRVLARAGASPEGREGARNLPCGHITPPGPRPGHSQTATARPMSLLSEGPVIMCRDDRRRRRDARLLAAGSGRALRRRGRPRPAARRRPAPGRYRRAGGRGRGCRGARTLPCCVRGVPPRTTACPSRPWGVFSVRSSRRGPEPSSVSYRSGPVGEPAARSGGESPGCRPWTTSIWPTVPLRRGSPRPPATWTGLPVLMVATERSQYDIGPQSAGSPRALRLLRRTHTLAPRTARRRRRCSSPAPRGGAGVDTRSCVRAWRGHPRLLRALLDDLAPPWPSTPSSRMRHPSPLPPPDLRRPVPGGVPAAVAWWLDSAGTATGRRGPRPRRAGGGGGRAPDAPAHARHRTPGRWRTPTSPEGRAAADDPPACSPRRPGPIPPGSPAGSPR